MARGRPSVFTEEVCEKILEKLEEGYPEEDACGYAGIGYRTYNRWKKEAKDHKTNTPKKCFFDKVDAAKSKGKYTLDNPIIEAINDGDVKTALRYAELRLKAKIARDAKESQDKLLDSQIVEITEDQVEWINNVSNYNQ